MVPYQILSSKVIRAQPETLFNIIIDYHVHHPAILPKRAFTGLTILEGGHGVGTVIKVKMKLLGQESTGTIEVIEATPYSRVVEKVIEQKMTTTFLFEPISDSETRVTFQTDAEGKSGLAGWFEKLIVPRALAKVYEEELEQLAVYAAQLEKTQGKTA